MSTITISNLPAAGALTGTEVLPIVQGGITSNTTVQNIANLTVSSSYATTASFAVTASYALNGGGGTDLSQVSQDILPALDEVYDLGSNNKKWYDGYFTNKIQLGDSSSVSVDVDNDFIINTNTVVQGTLSSNIGDFGNITISSSTISLDASEYEGSNLITLDGNVHISGTLTSNNTISPISVIGSTLYSNNPLAGNNNTVSSIFLGPDAGVQATNAYYSNFIGQNTGRFAVEANSSNFFGYDAGYQATNARNSNFLGYGAGYAATNAREANFLGFYAGYGATDAVSSNFFGSQAGQQATNAYESNFLGSSAGNGAISAFQSNFIGKNTGYLATHAYGSNFLGYSAGNQATNAQYSNFFGLFTGVNAINASYSTLIGYQAGLNNFGQNGIGPNNIIIGTNITLANDRRDSINLGAIIFATGSYSDVNTRTSGSVGNGKVGINVVNPLYNLDISGSVGLSDVLVLPFRHPLPSNKPTGSIALSGSGGTFVGMFVYNGTTWTSV